MAPPGARDRCPPGGCGRARWCAGFSLIELLAVLAILIILAVCGVAAFLGTSTSAGITSSAALLQGMLDNAHAQALALNNTVEVRFYARTPASGGAPVYNLIQAHWVYANGTTPPVSAALALPASVVIDATATHSPLIASNAQVATPDPTDRWLNSQTRVFHFLADGSTDLGSSASWFLTIRGATQSDPNNFPSNWASITVDPITGHTQIYRP